MDLQFEYFMDSLKSGITYLPATLKIALTSIFFGTILAMLVAVVRFYKIPILSQLLSIFVTVYQGIPSMVLMLIYHLLLVTYFSSFAQFFHLNILPKDVDVAVVGYFTLTIGTMVSFSESFRGALNSIERVQFEACYSVGMTTGQSIRRIILPQMFPIAFPSYMNNVISAFKSVPLLTAVGIVEVMNGALIPSARTYSFIEGYTATAVIYLVLIFCVNIVLSFIKNKFFYMEKKGM